jgi:hypothetical protein
MSDLARRVETVSRFVCCLTLSLVYWFVFVVIAIVLAHEGWLSPIFWSVLSGLLILTFGVVAALRKSRAPDILLYVVVTGLLGIDVSLIVTTTKEQDGGMVSAFRSAPILTGSWLLVWIGAQVCVVPLLAKHHLARRRVATAALV